MKRNANFFKATASLVMTGVAATVFTSCTDSTVVEATKLDEPTYSVTGTVVDGSGSTKGNLPGVIVGISGIDTIVASDNGMFLVDDVPYGDRSISFEYLDTAATPVDYTTAIYTIAGSNIDENNNDTTKVLNIKDQAGTVVLFPLDGSLTGTIYRQADASATPVPAEGIVVTADFVVDAGNGFDGLVVPETRFVATTDANGVYSFTGLPVSARADDALNLSIANTVDAAGNAWKIKAADAAAPQNVKLTRGVTVTAEKINLEPTNAVAKGLELVSSASFLTASKTEMFDLDKTAPLTITFVQDLSADNLTVVVKNGGVKADITTAIDAGTLTITPVSGLWSSVSAKNITIQATLADGTIVNIPSTTINLENDLDIVKTSVESNDGNAIVKEISVTEVISLWANQDVVKADATLKAGATEIPVTVVIDADDATLITVTPDIKLDYEATHTLDVITYNANGEANKHTIAGMKTEDANFFLLSSSILDDNMDPVENFDFVTPDTMTFTFNNELNGDLNTIDWDGTSTVNGSNTQDQNCKVTLSEDGKTLSIIVDQRTGITYDDDIDVKFTVKDINGDNIVINETITALPANDMLISTNTKDANGNNLLMASGATIEAVFGHDITSIDFSGVPYGKTAAGIDTDDDGDINTNYDILPSELEIVGDTVRFTPRMPLDPGSVYILKLGNVTLANGMIVENLPSVVWSTQPEANVVNIDNVEAGVYRQLPSSDATFTIELNKEIDATKAIDVAGLSVDYTTAVSEDKMSVTVTCLDPLSLADFDVDYADMADAAVAVTETVNVTGKTTDGNNFAVNGVKLFTERGLYLINTSFAKVSDPLKEFGAATSVVGEYDEATPITLTFTRAVDATKLTSDEIIFKVEGTVVEATAALDADDSKKVVITPTVALAKGQYFTVELAGVAAADIEVGAGNETVTVGEMTEVLTPVKAALTPITSLTPTIARVADEMLDHDNGQTLNFDLTRVAWDRDYRESVTAYVVEAKTATSEWSEYMKMGNQGEWTAFGEVALKEGTSQDISAANLDTTHLDFDNTNTQTGYSNAKALFATGDTISLQVTPVLIDTLGWEWDGGVVKVVMDTIYGTESPAITYFDNTPVLDSVNTGISMGVDGIGIEAVTVSGLLTFDRSIADPTGDIPADTMVITVEFAEDMDVAVIPEDMIGLISGAAADAATTDVKLSVDGGKWTSARTFEQNIIFPAVLDTKNRDLTYGDGSGSDVITGWGYNLDVSAFKDLSGNTNYDWGTSGAGAADYDKLNREAGSASIQVVKNSN